MKTRMLQLTLTAAAALSLQGCITGVATLAMSGLEGNGYCPPEVRQQAFYNQANLNTLYVGMTSDEVVYGMGLPEERYRERLLNRGYVDVWYYRTGHEYCRGLPTETEFSPVVFQDGKVMGAGLKYYDKKIARYVRSRAQLAGQNKTPDVLDGLMYPFNKAF